MTDRLQLGVISKPHGLKGEVKAYSITDDPYVFEDYDEVIIVVGKKEITVEIEDVRYFKNQSILKFTGLNRIEDIEGFAGGKIFIDREDAAPLEDDEYYIEDIIGADVYLDNGEKFGVLKDVLRTGANDVYSVQIPDGREILLPAIKECILEVDPEAKKITVHLLNGLM